MRMKPPTIIVAISAFVFRVLAQDTVSVIGADVTEVGIYRARVVKTFNVPGVVGSTNEGLDSFTLAQATTNIPARVGTRFGFRYTIHGTPSNAPIVLTMVGEHLIEQGHTCERDVPAPPIFYQGEFSGARRAQGTWIIHAQPIPLGDGRAIPMAETKGV